MLFQSSQSSLPGSKHRPETLSHWLLTRQYSHPLKISDLTMFGLEWLTWWNTLQPAWRKAHTHGTLPVPLDPKHPSTCTIHSLRKQGPNSLVTVLLGLKFWQLAGGNGDLWTQAVDDVASCFEDAATVSMPVKHLASSNTR
ncbi:hypothetical protein L208DRAFT_1282996 [Tricholoma matsutake]|nr:hypothetical protein L208DRAFT_1282996 [Tricholoma matsutake 945]